MIAPCVCEVHQNHGCDKNKKKLLPQPKYMDMITIVMIMFIWNLTGLILEDLSEINTFAFLNMQIGPLLKRH